jgi:hypothetical protein
MYDKQRVCHNRTQLNPITPVANYSAVLSSATRGELDENKSLPGTIHTTAFCKRFISPW